MWRAVVLCVVILEINLGFWLRTTRLTKKGIQINEDVQRGITLYTILDAYICKIFEENEVFADVCKKYANTVGEPFRTDRLHICNYD